MKLLHSPVLKQTLLLPLAVLLLSGETVHGQQTRSSSATSNGSSTELDATVTTSVLPSSFRGTPTPSCTGLLREIRPSDSLYAFAYDWEISTDDLVERNGLSYDPAEFPKDGTLCIEENCRSHMVKDGDTCTSIANDAGVSVDRLMTWNPNLVQQCDNIKGFINQTICISKPFYRDSSKPRWGLPMRKFLPPPPQPPTYSYLRPAGCVGVVTGTRNGSCEDILKSARVSLESFVQVNPEVGQDCSGVVQGEVYCIGPSIDRFGPEKPTKSRNNPTSPPPSRPVRIELSPKQRQKYVDDWVQRSAPRYQKTIQDENQAQELLDSMNP